MELEGTGNGMFFDPKNTVIFFNSETKNLGPDQNSMSPDPNHCFQPMLWILNVRYWLGRVTFDQT